MPSPVDGLTITSPGAEAYDDTGPEADSREGRIRPE